MQTKYLSDSYTKTITTKVAVEIEKLTNRKPYVVILNVHRSKMDANRPKDEATYGEDMASDAYDEYHGKIKKVKYIFIIIFNKCMSLVIL